MPKTKRKTTRPSSVSSLKAAFDEAHRDGMDALQRGDYDAFGEAVERESKVIDAVGAAVDHQSKLIEAGNAKPVQKRRK